MEKKVALLGVIQTNNLLFSNMEYICDSESDSSGDEDTILLHSLEENLRPRKRKLPRNKGYYEIVIPKYNMAEFQSHFRMTPNAFSALCVRLIPLIGGNKNTGRPHKNIEKQLLAVIWLLATPDSYRSVGEQFDLGKASLADAFVRIVHALNQIAPQIIKWPTPELRIAIMDNFYNYAGINGVIGAVDGTYIPIKAPKEQPHIYITRKMKYAFTTLQCIAEPSLKFTDTFIAYPGSVTDTRIFRNSDIYQMILANPNAFFNNNFILGDKAYPLLDWCIPPYIERHRLAPDQINFNIAHAKTRQVIERSFALLFGRFRRLKYLDMNKTNLIPATTLACCVLHNICIDHGDLQNDDYIRDGQQFLLNNAVEADIDFVDEEVAVAAQNRRDVMAIEMRYANQ